MSDYSAFVILSIISVVVGLVGGTTIPKPPLVFLNETLLSFMSLLLVMMGFGVVGGLTGMPFWITQVVAYLSFAAVHRLAPRWRIWEEIL